jgi:hypothetical protein
MKKIVVILPCPFPIGHEKHLVGVKEDVDNYIEFYTSANGGGYLREEINVLENFRPYQLQDVLNLCAGADIATIIFTGHGGMSSGGRTYLALNPQERIWVSQLQTTAKREIFILDNCRTGSVGYNNDTGGGIYGINFGFDTNNLELARVLYQQHITLSKPGRIALYASSPGQESMDSGLGGKFSLALLQSILNWNHADEGIALSVDKAFELAKIRLEKTSPGQIPEKRPLHDDSLEIPIALNPRLYIKNNSRQKKVVEPVQQSNGGGWLIAALIILGLIGLAAASSDSDD